VSIDFDNGCNIALTIAVRAPQKGSDGHVPSNAKEDIYYGGFDRFR